jgi:hypothetical protein
MRHRARRLRRRIAWSRAPWWERWPHELLRLEYDLPPEYGHFTCTRLGDALVYRGKIELDGLGITRKIAIVVPRRPSIYSPYVMADGPRPTRHRWNDFRPTRLCLWYARDPKGMRWTLEDGLVRLIDLARVHLIRELWFMSTGTWPAPEHHQPPNRRGTDHKDALTRERRRCWCGRGRYAGCHGAVAPEDELVALGIA